MSGFFRLLHGMMSLLCMCQDVSKSYGVMDLGVYYTEGMLAQKHKAHQFTRRLKEAQSHI